MRRLLILACVFIAGIEIPTAGAQVLINTEINIGEDHFQISPVLSFLDTNYHVADHGTLTVDRSIFGLAEAYGLNKVLDVYGELAWVIQSKLEDEGESPGILTGGGLRGLLWQQGQVSLHGNAGVRYIKEGYGNSIDGYVFEVPLGITARQKLTHEFAIYGAVDVTPYSDGQVGYSTGHKNSERADNVGFRLGADYKLDWLILFSGEFSFLGDEGVTFRVTLPM